MQSCIAIIIEDTQLMSLRKYNYYILPGLKLSYPILFPRLEVPNTSKVIGEIINFVVID